MEESPRKRVGPRAKRTILGVLVALALAGLVVYAFLANVLGRSGLSVQTVGDMKIALYTIPNGYAGPNPPKSGLNTVDVRLLDVRNRPISGAMVEVEYAMDGMGEGGKFVAMPELSNGPGAYSGVANFGMAGSWQVRVKVTRQEGQESEARYSLTVKD